MLFLFSKTVTWADDIDNNFKKLDSTQHHEKQDTEILHDTDSFSNNKDGQQYQNEYLAPEYSDVNNGIEVEPNVSNIQYDDNQYQAQSIDPNNQIAYNNEYYYPDQELNQYEQQYDPQQIQAVSFFTITCNICLKNQFNLHGCLQRKSQLLIIKGRKNIL